MATPVATASPDRKLRRQAQAQQHADEGGGGGIGILLLALGLGGLGVYELTKSKTLTCPTGFTLTNGQCVQAPPTVVTPPPSGGKVLPPGFPANYCSLSAIDQQIGIVWLRLLGRFPGDYTAEEAVYNGQQVGLPGGLAGVAEYITQAPQGEFAQDVANEVANPVNPPANWGVGTYEDHLIAVTFQRFLQRWPDADLATSIANPVWQVWLDIESGYGIPGLAREAFAPSAEFSNGVAAQAASYC